MVTGRETARKSGEEVRGDLTWVSWEIKTAPEAQEVRDLVVDRPALPSQSKPQYQRIIAETAPSPWLAQWSVFMRYLGLWELSANSGWELWAGSRAHVISPSSSFPQSGKLLGGVRKNWDQKAEHLSPSILQHQSRGSSGEFGGHPEHYRYITPGGTKRGTCAASVNLPGL